MNNKNYEKIYKESNKLQEKEILLNEDLFECIFNESLNRLVESTELANLKKLEAQLETDKELDKLLKTPAKDLKTAHKYLVEEIYDDYADKTLYYLIQESCRRLKSTSFFSVAGNKIVGFFAYIIGEENKIDGIKMFSFDLSKPNSVLASDLIKLIKNLQQKYAEINWCALKENPANIQYKKIMEKLNGSVKDISEKACQYTIPGKNN